MRLLVSLFLLTTVLHAAPLALRDGESLSYRVGWGVFLHAGDIKIAADDATDAHGAPILRVTTATDTKGFVNALYTFMGRAEATFDAKAGRLLTNTETTKMPNKEKQYSVIFDYDKGVANYTNPLEPMKSAALPLPPGDPFDIIMSLVQTRLWDLKPGESRDALVIHEDEFYDLTIHAVGYEKVRTPLGTFDTLVLEPRMEKSPPKGMFKRNAAVRVWISQDAQRLPVKFQLEFKFGAGVATLAKYQPPNGVAPLPPAVAEAKPDSPTPDAKTPRS